MKFTFENIPEECRFTVFDYDNKDRTGKSWRILAGTSSFDYQIPSEWNNPYYSINTLTYYVPNQFEKLPQSRFLISGANFYLDITRNKPEAELNQESIEKLIYGIQQNANLDFRQKFYIALVSLQSYFEYLCYGMIVLSGYKTHREFEELKNSNNRINSGFSKSNTNFFTDKISICPGKESFGQLIKTDSRLELQGIFHMIRSMRNDVVHSWSYNNLSKEQLKKSFESVGEQVKLYLDIPEFYADVTQNFVRLYARVNYIRSQLLYFREKEYIKLERAERGYYVNGQLRT